MLRPLMKKPGVALATGLGLGLLVGIGMMVGALTTVSLYRSPQAEFPAHLLNATSTDSTSTMAIATGPIEGGVEGLFILDFLTGDLQCMVMNPRNGSLGGLYKQNVILDLGVEQGKQPRYLMVTGQANFRVGAGNTRPAQSVVYVADANTGRWAAYALPWNTQAQNYNFTQTSPMFRIGGGDARQLQVE